MRERVCQWRFEQISGLLDSQLTPEQRSHQVDQLSSRIVVWPNARESTISRATLYRWYRQYKESLSLSSLQPRQRTRISEGVVKKEWVDYALTLLEEEPGRSLYVVRKRALIKFELEKQPSHASFYRALAKQPRYHAIKAGSKGVKLRKRFEAYKAHYLWYCDAKGSFEVCFANGERKKVSVLSILDDKTRYVLAAVIVESESISSAAETFITAALRWGLCEKLYPDRGSCYDSTIFRKALAMLGVYRVWTRPRNPSAHGKIEAYHRVLKRWFVKELKHQVINDLIHLQQLLTAMIETMYNTHYHRGIKMSPAEALANRPSERRVTMEQLNEVFFDGKKVLPHKKSGEVFVHGISFKVPPQYLTPRHHVTIQWNVARPDSVYLYDETTMQRIPLYPAVTIVGTAHKPFSLSEVTSTQLPVGSLSPLLDIYRGKKLPQANPGFGLYEIGELFSQALHRHVPQSDSESSRILQWLKKYGPLTPESFIHVLTHTLTNYDTQRPLSLLLEKMGSYIESRK